MAVVLKVLNAKKAKQEINIPVKLIKENIELFSSVSNELKKTELFSSVFSRMFNFYIDKTYFLNSLKKLKT